MRVMRVTRSSEAVHSPRGGTAKLTNTYKAPKAMMAAKLKADGKVQSEAISACSASICPENAGEAPPVDGKVTSAGDAPPNDYKKCKPDCLPGFVRCGHTLLSNCPNARKLKAEGIPKNAKSCHEVYDLLRKMGIDHPEWVNRCAKKAISYGHLNVTGSPKDLEQVIYTGPTLRGCMASAKLKDFIWQAEIGSDYDSGSRGANITCDVCHNEKLYLTNVCIGDPTYDPTGGKFQNHCIFCPGFGTCVADHRNCEGDFQTTHCGICQHHGFLGCINKKCGMYGIPDSTTTEDSQCCISLFGWDADDFK